jgi:hypothetical protein
MHKSSNSLSESLGYSLTSSQKKQSDSIKAPSSDDSSSKKCSVCQKGFLLRRKLTCQICLNVFCTDHCTRKRTLEGFDEPQPICDPCNEEETKREIALEIDREIQTLTAELQLLKDTNEKLFKEHYTNAASLNNLDMEIKKQEWNNKKQEDDLLYQLEAEQNRGIKLRNQVDVMRKNLDELSRSEKALCDGCLDAEHELQSVQIQSHELEAQKTETLAHIERLNVQLRESLSLEQIRRILCERCLRLVNQSLDGRLGEDFENREIKDISNSSLPSLESEAADKKCTII